VARIVMKLRERMRVHGWERWCSAWSEGRAAVVQQSVAMERRRLLLKRVGALRRKALLFR
jgi:hypothetical protein